jgi:predicted AAA+ superfamily ATPase
MSARRVLFERIAAALERLAPPVAPPTDWSSAPAYVFDGERAQAVAQIDALTLGTLRGVDEQKQAVLANMERLAGGAAAHDMLLWGARGMGKSALIRAGVAAVNEREPGLLALIQLSRGALDHLPALFDQLAQQRRGFVLFLDDLGFGEGDAQGNLALRSLLDGGVMARPANVRLAVTSNRRAIVARDPHSDDALHERDERDNTLALADRFGLRLGFHPCDRETYLEIVRTYTDPLSLTFDPEEALAWSIARGNRSGRSAYQYAVELAGRAGKAL